MYKSKRNALFNDIFKTFDIKLTIRQCVRQRKRTAVMPKVTIFVYF